MPINPKFSPSIIKHYALESDIDEADLQLIATQYDSLYDECVGDCNDELDISKLAFRQAGKYVIRYKYAIAIGMEPKSAAIFASMELHEDEILDWESVKFNVPEFTYK